MNVAGFNAMPPQEAAELLRPVCASDAWLRALTESRPYQDLDGLAARSDAVLAALDWPDIEQALAAHPRIGERPGGTDREATWSRQEQSAAGDIPEALRASNVAYEQRFGYVFLICATGRTAEQMLAELTRRLGNDPVAEQQEVRRELAAIVRVRLAKALG